MSQIHTIKETNKTPLVEFDYSTGKIKISGKIIAENPAVFFGELEQLLDDYIIHNSGQLSAEIYLDYFNSVCSKSFLKFLRKMISSQEVIEKVDINWHYQKDDVELKEAGEDYAFILQFPFQIKEMASKN